MIKKYAISMLDQSVLSAFQFALGLFLLRTWNAELFGVFSFWQTIVFLMVGVQTALIKIPLSIHLPARNNESDRHRVEAVFSRVNFGLIIVTVVVVLGVSVLLREANLVVLSLVVFAAMLLFREYVKGVALARLHPASVLWADLSYISLCSTLFLVYSFGGLPLTLPIVFGVVGLGSLFGGVTGISAENSNPMAHPFQATLREYSKVWEQSRWALFGLISSHLQSRGYVFLVSGLAGFAALGTLSAGMVLLRPLQVLYRGWASISRPQLAAAVAAHDRTSFARILAQGLGLILIALIGLYTFLFLFWNHIETLVFSGRYEQIGFTVAGWSIVTACQSFRGVLQTALAAFNKFQPAAIATTYGAIVSLLAIAALLQFLHWTWVIAGLVAGEMVSIGYLFPRTIIEMASLRGAKAQPLREG